MGASDFHLIALELGAEEQMLDGALDALEEVEAGETAFLPEYLAWSESGSGRAFARLVAFAQERDINIITTLNLGAELAEDLPGHDPAERYNALTIFTRHGAVHVPQAKFSTQSFEMDKSLDGPGIGVTPYARINRVKLDVDDALLDACFLICSDLVVMQQLTPRDLACDLMVVLGNFAYGAERVAMRLLGRALECRAAATAVLVNAYQLSNDKRRPPLANKVEEVLDGTSTGKPRAKWPSPQSMRAAFHVYDDEDAHDFVSMCKLPRRGRIAVPRSRWAAPVAMGVYPVTVVL
ncbi:MAG TPA: hypothetical protein VFF06_09915 [Polyangia bacterium]|nr:hypothetical protein [Polyangia bacterium]